MASLLEMSPKRLWGLAGLMCLQLLLASSLVAFVYYSERLLSNRKCSECPCCQEPATLETPDD